MRKEKALKIAKINREECQKVREEAQVPDRGPSTLADRQRAQEREEGKGCCGKFSESYWFGGAPAEKAGPESPYARRERLRRQREEQKKKKQRAARKMAAQVEKVDEEEVIDYAGLAVEFEKTTMTLAHYLPWYQFDREKTEVGFHWTLKDNGFPVRERRGASRRTGHPSSVPTMGGIGGSCATICY